MLLPKPLAQSEMERGPSRFWTRVAMFSFDDDNRYPNKLNILDHEYKYYISV